MVFRSVGSSLPFNTQQIAMNHAQIQKSPLPKHLISLLLSAALTGAVFGQVTVQTDSAGTTLLRPSAGKLRTAIIKPATMSSTAIDVTKTRLERALAGNDAETFSATPTKDTAIDVVYTADSTARTVTWNVVVYSYYQDGDIHTTGIVVPASGTLPVTLFYSVSRSRWEILGDPPLTNGTGNFLRSAGTAAIASGKTVTASNSMTLTATDGSTIAFGAGGTVIYSGGAIGAATATTATAADSSTKVATTAFVAAATLQTEVTLTDGATVTQTMVSNQADQNAKVTLGGNRTLAFSGLAAGMRGNLRVIQDGTGSRTLALPASSRVNGSATTVTLLTAAAAENILSWYSPDGSAIRWTNGTY